MSSLSLQGVLDTLVQFPALSYAAGIVKDVLIGVLKTGPMPNHVALIMDGNRRYAKTRRLALKEGHMAGAESLIQVCVLVRGFLTRC